MTTGEPGGPNRQQRAAIAVTAGPAAPGTGWPGDPATARTLVATGAEDVARLAGSAGSLRELAARQSVCRACPRLVSWREEVAAVRRRAYATEPYWGRPVPGWGADRPAIVIAGLAPAAHGGNRTGRIFTGDRSGDVLFASLFRTGLARLPHSWSADDGQALIGARMVAAVRCAPPANKPDPAERDTCAPWLAAELALVAASVRVVVCLGQFAWQAIWRELGRAGYQVPVRRPLFGHGSLAQAAFPGGSEEPGPLWILASYHPSQQNTFTGRVTPAMLDAVFERARHLAHLDSSA